MWVRRMLGLMNKLINGVYTSSIIFAAWSNVFLDPVNHKLMYLQHQPRHTYTITNHIANMRIEIHYMSSTGTTGHPQAMTYHTQCLLDTSHIYDIHAPQFGLLFRPCEDMHTTFFFFFFSLFFSPAIITCNLLIIVLLIIMS